MTFIITNPCELVSNAMISTAGNNLERLHLICTQANAQHSFNGIGTTATPVTKSVIHCVARDKDLIHRVGQTIKRHEVREGEIVRFLTTVPDVVEADYCTFIFKEFTTNKWQRVVNAFTIVDPLFYKDKDKNGYIFINHPQALWSQMIHAVSGTNVETTKNLNVKVIGRFCFETGLMVDLINSDGITWRAFKGKLKGDILVPMPLAEKVLTPEPKATTPPLMLIDGLAVEECLRRYEVAMYGGSGTKESDVALVGKHPKAIIGVAGPGNKKFLHGVPGTNLNPGQLAVAMKEWTAKVKRQVLEAERKRRADIEVKVQPEFDPWD